MTIGERRIVAQIREKQQARAQYEAAKAAGKSAALLEQHRPNVFKMNVANILPGDDIAVELRYTELIVPTDSIYEFVFPTVVGPRYTTDRAAGTAPLDRWQSNLSAPGGRHRAASASGDRQFGIRSRVSPSHAVQARFDGAYKAYVELPREGGNEANRDFILRYRLAGASIESGILLFEGARENYFLAMIEPPQRVTPAQIPARDYVFIVDVSGSMTVSHEGHEAADARPAHAVAADGYLQRTVVRRQLAWCFMEAPLPQARRTSPRRRNSSIRRKAAAAELLPARALSHFTGCGGSCPQHRSRDRWLFGSGQTKPRCHCEAGSGGTCSLSASARPSTASSSGMARPDGRAVHRHEQAKPKAWRRCVATSRRPCSRSRA
jgi:hypothetical protein